MAYHTLSDIQQTIPAESVIILTDDNGLGIVDVAILDALISQTDSEIDLYLRSLYAVPLAAPVPPLITGIACDITVYKLYKRRMETISDTRLKSYQMAIAMLKDIRDGKTVLPHAPAAVGGNDFASGVMITERNNANPWGLPC